MSLCDDLCAFGALGETPPLRRDKSRRPPNPLSPPVINKSRGAAKINDGQGLYVMFRYSTSQKIHILCGLNILLLALHMGFACLFQFISRWDIGVYQTFLFTAINVIINVRKYKLSKSLCDIGKFRVIFIDSALVTVGVILLWINLFVPYPFTAEEFFARNNGVILPFGAWIACVILLIPTVMTNKKITKSLQ